MLNPEVQTRVDAWMKQNLDSEAKPEMVWVDIETTGLTPGDDVILEIAIFVTDRDGFVVETFQSLLMDFWARAGVKEWVATHQDTCDEIVLKMHTDSGLWEDLANADLHGNLAGHWPAIRTFLYEYGPETRKPMAGSSVDFDRGFIKNQVEGKDFDEFFTHRVVDVSVLIELAKLHSPDVMEGYCEEYTPIGAHRGVPDLIDTIELYRYLVKNFLWTSEDQAVIDEALKGEGE